MYSQLYDYFDNVLFPSQCGLGKGYSAQHFLLVMIEKFKESIDRGNEFGAHQRIGLYKLSASYC